MTAPQLGKTSVAPVALRQGVTRFILYLAAALLLLVAAAFVRSGTGHTFFYEVGRNAALIALMLLALQVVLAARLRWATRPFGLDMVLRFHKIAAWTALVLLILHPLLMAWSEGRWALLTQWRQPWNIQIARLALLALLANVVVSYWRRSLAFDFEQWRAAHNVAAIIIVALAFTHVYVTGVDFARPAAAWLLWLVFAAAAAVYMVHKLLVPARRRRFAYQVSKVRQETHDTWSIHFDPPEGEKRFDFAPGQFHFVTLHRGDDLPPEEHHFTISWPPTRPGLASTIKESGDFTATIGRTSDDDRAEIQGPFGRFSHVLYPHEKNLVFLAGGIGITPLISMLRYMHDVGDDRRVMLLWANKTEEDIPFKVELEEIVSSGTPALTVTHFLGKPPPKWQGETGFIDRAALEGLLDMEIRRAWAFYVCAPEKMADMVIEALRDLGVGADRIHYERFSL